MGLGCRCEPEGVRRVKGRDGWRPVCPYPGERGVVSPAQLFVCVHTTLAWEGGRNGGGRPRRSGDACGPDYQVNRPASPLMVPVGPLPCRVCPRTRAPRLLGQEVLRLYHRGAPAVACVRCGRGSSGLAVARETSLASLRALDAP